MPQALPEETKIILTAILSIFPLLGLLIILTKHIKMGRYAVGLVGPLSLNKISGGGALMLGIALIIFGATMAIMVWVLL